MATSIKDCVEMVKQVQASEEQRIFGIGHGELIRFLCEIRNERQPNVEPSTEVFAL